MPDYLLSKIGRADRMTSLLSAGAVFMQRLEFFRGLEDGVVGDPNEGLLAHYSGDNATLRVSITIEGTEDSFPLEHVNKITVDSPATEHAVFCMSGLRLAGSDDPGDPSSGPLLTPSGEIIYDRRLAGFGDTMVVFHDNPEFIRRMLAAARGAGIDLDHHHVRYERADYCGEMGPFRKLEQYRYQGEVRFVTTTPVDAPVRLLLGPLEDIAWLVRFAPHVVGPRAGSGCGPLHRPGAESENNNDTANAISDGSARCEVERLDVR